MLLVFTGQVNMIKFLLASILLLSIGAQAQSAPSNITVKIVGYSEAFERKVPGISEKAICFRVDMVDVVTGLKVGNAVDCLSEITPQDSGGVTVLGTTFFKFKEGKIVSRGRITIKPVEVQTNVGGLNVTHITGAATESSNIVKSDGLFEDATGNVRLSGMVDMSGFAGNVGDKIGFNCIFTISNLAID